LISSLKKFPVRMVNLLSIFLAMKQCKIDIWEKYFLNFLS